MPYTTRADGDVLTASSHNANCRDQVISTVTSATRPAGTEGQIIYETDTDRYQAYTGSGWVPFGGLGTWTTYTPAVTQSVGVTATIIYARYIKIGRLVNAQISLTTTSAGSANAVITISAPVTATSVGGGNLEVGGGHIYDASTALAHPGITVLTTTSLFALLDTTGGTINVLLGQTGTDFNGALASGDYINVTATYEAAA